MLVVLRQYYQAIVQTKYPSDMLLIFSGSYKPFWLFNNLFDAGSRLNNGPQRYLGCNPLPERKDFANMES
jgi:hypothetical protein